MENRKVVQNPVQEGSVKVKPDDFEPKTNTSGAQTVDPPVTADPPVCSYSVPPTGDTDGRGERP